MGWIWKCYFSATSSQFISAEVNKNLNKYQTGFREKFKKLRLKQKNDFLMKNVYLLYLF